MTSSVSENAFTAQIWAALRQAAVVPDGTAVCHLVKLGR